VSEDFDYIKRAAMVGRFRVYPHVFVYHSVRRYLAEGVGSLVQKQLTSGFIYLFTGKASDTDDYKFGTFSRYVMEEREGRRADPDSAEVKKLLSSFDTQTRRLRTQIEKMEERGAAVEARSRVSLPAEKKAGRGEKHRKARKRGK
jgi:hypothetical protein